MTTTWHSERPPAPAPIGSGGWVRILLRGLPLVLLLAAGLGLTLLLRLVEKPLCAPARPLTSRITVAVCRAALRLLGLRVVATGRPLAGDGAVVANHSSWLDIFVLNARKRIYFVSKAEVAGWPGIGALARATGTVFIDRKRGSAAAQAEVFRTRLAAGHRLLFFPEGTSSDNGRVLPFKSTLFAAFFAEGLRARLVVQPVSLRFFAPPGRDARFFAWWGDMDFAPHLAQVLAAPRGGAVRLVYHPPLRVADFADRKALAAACEAAVRAGHDAATRP